MNLNFAFNPKTHDYWAIYQSIKEYYPIGLSKQEGGGIYFKYPGLKKLEEIVVDNIHDQANFEERWVKFTEEIGQELDKEMVGTTYGQAPSFSSAIVLLRQKIENCLHTKALHFSVSLAGDYFQIYGVDETTIWEAETERGYIATNVITTSPYAEYKAPFEYVEKKLRDKFREYKIIPFSIGQTVVHGLQVRYIDDENCTINQALFNHFIGKGKEVGLTRGDRRYGEADWRK